MYSASDLRKGLKIVIDGQPWLVTEFTFTKPGKGAAIYACRLKNMITGATTSRNFRSNDTFEKPDLQQKALRFSYVEGDRYAFFDEHYEQIELTAEVLGRNRFFLVEDLECETLFFNGQAIEVNLPFFIERTVASTDPGVRGNTASGNVSKPARLEGGYELQVPLFVNTGDVIRVDTRTGEYADRVR